MVSLGKSSTNGELLRRYPIHDWLLLSLSCSTFFIVFCTFNLRAPWPNDGTHRPSTRPPASQRSRFRQPFSAGPQGNFAPRSVGRLDHNAMDWFEKSRMMDRSWGWLVFSFLSTKCISLLPYRKPLPPLRPWLMIVMWISIVMTLIKIIIFTITYNNQIYSVLDMLTLYHQYYHKH